jgi:hypothetical protein
VNDKFTNLVGAAPDVLNTIVELATALGNDANYATAIQNQLNGKAAAGASYSKSEVDGMLSTNGSAYQPKLVVDRADGRPLLRDDGRTLMALDEGAGIKLTPMWTIDTVNGVASNYRIQIKVSDAFTSTVDGKLDSSTAQTSYQAKLTNNNTIGYSVLGPDNRTMYNLEASTGIYLVATATTVGSVTSNYRIQIKVDDVYTAAAQTYANTSSATAVRTVNTAWSATSGQINFSNPSTGNYIAWNAVRTAPPAFTNRSVGTKLVLYPGISASVVDYSIGIDSADGGTLWYAAGATSSTHRWYCATTHAMNLSTAGLSIWHYI